MANDHIIHLYSHTTCYIQSMEDNNGILQPNVGAIYILLMTSEGTVKSYVALNSTSAGVPPLYGNDFFGNSLASLGDLDEDGVVDIAVGAPGSIISSVYILYLNSDSTIKNYVLVRGEYEADDTGSTLDALNVTSNSTIWRFNGPPIHYLSKFGTSLANVGDIDGDNITDLAVGSNSESKGIDVVQILFLYRNGTVREWSTIGSNIGGGPKIPITFSKFGSSVTTLGDFDGDGVNDLVIGARYLDDFLDTNTRSGVIYVCFMHQNGTVRDSRRISLWSEQLFGYLLPWRKGYECGSALTSIGDINRDEMRQQVPYSDNPSQNTPGYDKGLHKGSNGLPDRQPITDIVVGCPTPETGKGTGKMYLLFQREDGYQQGYREIPSITDYGRYDTAPLISEKDMYGAALSGYQDVDSNGIKEIVVGSPGYNNSRGAVYLMFLRRRRFHAPIPDTFMYWFKILFPIGMFILCYCLSCCYFFWYFRRRPDEVEIAVLASDLEIGKQRDRKAIDKSGESGMNDDEFPS